MNTANDQIIQSLADKFGTTAEHLWGVLVQQVYISAAFEIVVLMLIIAITILVYNKTQPRIKKFPNEIEFTILMGIVYSILSGISLVLIYYILTGLANPEYSALMTILGR